MRKNLGGPRHIWTRCVWRPCSRSDPPLQTQKYQRRRLPSLKKGVPQDVIKAEPLKLGLGVIKTDLEKVIAEKEEEVPLKDPTESLSMGEKKASKRSAGTQTEGKTEAEESDVVQYKIVCQSTSQPS